MKIKIRTLSPIVIENGEIATTDMDYYEKDGKIYKINFNKLAEEMERNEKLKKAMKESFEKNLKQNNPVFSLKEIFEQSQIDYKPFVDYELSLALEEEAPKAHREVKCYINILNKPYIPGSSVKGALRIKDIPNKDKQKGYALIVRDFMPLEKTEILLIQKPIFRKNGTKKEAMLNIYSEAIGINQEFEGELLFRNEKGKIVNNEEQLKKWVDEALKEYRAYIEKEKKEFMAKDQKVWDDVYNFYDGLKNKKVIHVGQGLSQTYYEGNYIKKKNKTIKNPKTRKLCNFDGKYYPLGWVELEYLE